MDTRWRARGTASRSARGYITVTDVDALYAEYRRAGAELTQPLLSKPWGMREFGIRTIDGHRLMFGQEL